MIVDTALAGYRFERASADVLAADIVRRYESPDDPAATVAAAEHQLTLGHERYRHRRYGEALAAYQLAEGLLYSLAVPRFDPRTNQGQDVRLPVDRALFTALAESALTTLQVAPDTGPPVAVGPRHPVAVPAVLEPYTQVVREPVVLSSDLPDRVVTGVRDGVRALRSGDLTRAAALRERAPETAVRTLQVTAGAAGAGGVRVVEVPLAADDAPEILRRELYRPRRDATTVAELGYRSGGAFLPGHFEAHVPHHYFYTVQLCLGDTYRKLGRFPEAMQRYERARDYEFLNPAVEAPVVWARMAECVLDWGMERYRAKRHDEAAEQFRRLVVVEADGTRAVPAGSALYADPPFAAIAAGVSAYLAQPDAVPPQLSTDMAVAVRRAVLYQEMLHAGLNALGLPVDLVPVFRFRYLQGVARYFAEQAIRAEREYITFLSNSEQATASELQLRQAVELAAATVDLEDRRVAEAQAERAVAEASRQLAQQRVDNAQQRIDEYAVVSADRVALDTATAHASGSLTETEGGYQVHLATSGETVNLGDQDYEIMRNAAWHRGMIQRQFELDDMARTRQEYESYRVVADRQVALSERRVAVAAQSRAVAALRHQQARQLLEQAENQTFDAALWAALAERMRELATLYLDRAIELAYIMQAAYNFEQDTTLDVIALTYQTAEAPDGLLGGQALLADIDYFAYHQITQASGKEIPLRTVLSLAEHFPFSLFRFRRTGTATFETVPELFDRLHPGSYLHRIRAVEVVVEGVVPADGLHGQLRNTGVSVFRTADNGIRVRLQPAETQLLSSYTIRGDVLVFGPSESTRGVFEGAGVCTAWTLTVPPDANDLRYESVSDIKVVLYHTARHDVALEQQVRAALPTTGHWSRTFSLRESRPDGYFQLLETGAAEFTLAAGDFPYHHLAPVIERIAVYAAGEQGPVADLVVDLASPAGPPVRTRTGPDGTVSSGDGDALDALVSTTPLGGWQVALRADANPGLFHEDPVGSGVLRVHGLRDLVISFDYGYTVRTGP